MPLTAGAASATMRSSPHSGAAGWARCMGRVTHGSGAMWRYDRELTDEIANAIAARLRGAMHVETERRGNAWRGGMTVAVPRRRQSARPASAR